MVRVSAIDVDVGGTDKAKGEEALRLLEVNRSEMEKELEEIEVRARSA